MARLARGTAMATANSTPFDVLSSLVMRSTVFGIADAGQGRMSLIGQVRGCRHHPNPLTSTAAPFTRSWARSASA